MNDTDNERLVYDEQFAMGKRLYSLECRNFDTQDSVRLAVQNRDGIFISFSSIDFPIDMPNSDKKLVADSVSSDARWIKLLKMFTSIKFTPDLMQTIHDLRDLGASDSLACTLATLVQCGDDLSLSATDIYKNFRQAPELQYYASFGHDKFLMIYADLCVKFSIAAAENIFKVLQGNILVLTRTHRDLMQGNWPGECAEYVAKISAIGLDIFRSFRIEHIDGPLDWMAPITRIISELSDYQLHRVIDTATKIAMNDESVRSHHYFFFKYSSHLNAERPWISALILEKYDSSILKIADEILTVRFAAYDCSVYKLITVCEFLNRQGSADTPVEWMLEL